MDAVTTALAALMNDRRLSVMIEKADPKAYGQAVTALRNAGVGVSTRDDPAGDVFFLAGQR